MTKRKHIVAINVPFINGPDLMPCPERGDCKPALRDACRPNEWCQCGKKENCCKYFWGG